QTCSTPGRRLAISRCSTSHRRFPMLGLRDIQMTESLFAASHIHNDVTSIMQVTYVTVGDIARGLSDSSSIQGSHATGPTTGRSETAENVTDAAAIGRCPAHRGWTPLCRARHCRRQSTASRSRSPNARPAPLILRFDVGRGTLLSMVEQVFGITIV